MKKISVLLTSCFLSVVLFAGIASAHVTVTPKETVQGTYEVFTVRVPNEKDIPSTKVEVKIPAEVDISRFEPKEGWKYEIIRDTAKKITSIVWTATGEGLTPTEFGDFKMQGKVSDTAATIAWKAYQTYKDGTVVEWTGAPDAKTPASVTTVKPKPATSTTPTDSHGNSSAAPVPTSPPAAPSQTPLYLSIAALILGVLSLIVSWTKKAK